MLPADLPAGPWERQSGETARAYAAFLRFRDLGPGRSLAAAYRAATGRQQAGEPSGQWRGWHAAHAWRARAEAWDAHLARQAQAEQEAEHARVLAEYLARQRILAARQHDAALELLNAAGERLAAMDPQEIPVAAIPAFLRAAAAVAEAASNAEAQALGVAELLTLLDERPR